MYSYILQSITRTQQDLLKLLSNEVGFAPLFYHVEDSFKATLINSHGKCEWSLWDAPKEEIEAAHIIPVADNRSDWFGNGILL